MTAESLQTGKDHKEIRVHSNSGGVYGIGLIGAWIFYFKGVTTFQQGVKAFFKGLFWPAFLVYDLLVFLKKD